MISLPANIIFTNISFSEGWMWWPLLGLLVPIIIHLLSKREKNVVSFGSLQFLQPLESTSARSIQLSQYALLLMRMLLLAVLCLLVAGPMLQEDKEKVTAYWIEESIYNDADYQGIIHDIPEDGTINLFSHAISDALEVSHFASAWTLIDHLTASEDSSVVYSHSLQRDFIGPPKNLNGKVDWKILPKKHNKTAKGIAGTGSNMIEWTVIAESLKLSVEEKATQENINAPTNILNLQLILNEETKEGLNTGQKNVERIKKVIALSQPYLYYDLNWVSDKSEADWIIKIVNDDNKDNTIDHENDGDTEQYSREAFSKTPSIQWQPSNHHLQIESTGDLQLKLKGKIDRESILDSNLPVLIASYFNKDYTSIADDDIRVFDPSGMEVLDTETVQAESNIESSSSSHNRPLRSYLMLLFVPIILGERFLQSKSNTKV